VTQLKYKLLTNKQLAKMVYELNKEMVRLNIFPGTTGPGELKEKALKMINRARLEGIL